MSNQVHMWLVLAAGAVSTYLHKKAGVPENVHHSFMGLLGLAMTIILRTSWGQADVKILEAKIAALTAKAAGVLLLVLSLVGCGVSPATIQTTTALGVSGGLTLAAIADPAEKPNIDKTVRDVVVTANQLSMSFWPGATSAGLLNNAVPTAISILKRKIAASGHADMILSLINAAQTEFASALGGTASPAAIMTPATRADALALLNGIAIAGSNYLKDPTLMPPQPPAAPPPSPPASPPAPPPSPPPSPVPPK